MLSSAVAAGHQPLGQDLSLQPPWEQERKLQLQVKAARRDLHTLLTDLPSRPQGSQGYSRFPPVTEARKGPAGPNSSRLDHRKAAPHSKKVSLGMLAEDGRRAPEHSPSMGHTRAGFPDRSLGCSGSRITLPFGPVGISVLITAFLREKSCSEDTPLLQDAQRSAGREHHPSCHGLQFANNYK